MKISEVELPSNRKFGFFFSVIFLVFSLYFYFENKAILSSLFCAFGFLFLITTLVKANILLPLNKLWMRLGLLLGMIVSPIVLGLIFFGLFTPISILMRLSGRDELSLRFKKKKSHWVIRGASTIKDDAFKYQF